MTDDMADFDTLAAPGRRPDPGFGGEATLAGDEAAAVTDAPAVSPRIGRFNVLSVLGQGGMGRVYTAYDERLDRRVAVKVLRRDVGEQSRRRVEREAKAMAKLTHPNVVSIYEVDDDKGELFIAMEFVQGDPLDKWQGKGGMAPEQFETSDVGAAADHFAFCVALWEGVYGERPFAGDTLPNLIHAVTMGEPSDPPKNTAVPAWLRDALRKGLAKKPEDRWPSMRALLNQLGRDPSGRRRRWVVAGVAALAIGRSGALGQSRLGASGELCPDSSALLDGVWDEATRETAESAFAATGLPFAASTWDEVAPRIDAYTKAWTSMHADVCEATRVRGEQSEEVMHLRMACLHHAMMGLEAASAVLRDADADVVTQAKQLVDGLDEIDHCADVGALRADVPPPPPELAATVEEAHVLLARSRAQREAFQYDRASASSKAADELIAGLDYAPIHAEVALERAYGTPCEAHPVISEPPAADRRGPIRPKISRSPARSGRAPASCTPPRSPRTSPRTSCRRATRGGPGA